MSPLSRRKNTDQGQLRRRPALLLWLTLFFLAILRTVAFILALADGYRLWFPEFAAYAIAMLIAIRIIGVQVVPSSAGLARIEARISPAIASFFAAFFPTIFAAIAIAGASLNTLIVAAFLCIFVSAGTRLDRKQLSQRIRTTLGSPRGRLMEPPHRTGMSPRLSDPPERPELFEAVTVGVGDRSAAIRHSRNFALARGRRAGRSVDGCG